MKDTSERDDLIHRFRELVIRLKPIVQEIDSLYQINAFDHLGNLLDAVDGFHYQGTPGESSLDYRWRDHDRWKRAKRRSREMVEVN